MNTPETYTHLETLLLWESILRDGVDPSAWTRISEKLTNNEYIKQNPTYNAARLKVEPLQAQLFKTLQAELGDNGRHVEEITSPGGTKKRKLDGNVPLPGLKELSDNLELIPAIIGRLWERYRQHQVQAIRDDEAAHEKTSFEVKVLEKSEKERLENLAAQPAQPTLAPKETKPTVTPPGASQSPVPTPTQAQTSKRGPASTTPVVPPKPPTPIAAPGHLPPGGPPARPPSATQASNGTGGVLQAPAGPPPPQQPSRVLQAPSPAPKVPISPRPDSAKPKDNAPPQGAPPQQAQGQLNWQKPYQPPGPVQTPQRQTQSPVPPRAATPQQYAQHQHQQWQQQTQQQQQQQYPQGQVTAPQPYPQQPQQPPPQQPQQQQQQPSQQQGKPPLAPPQNAGQTVPQIQPGPPRPTGAAPSPQPRPQSKTPIPPPHRPIQPHQPQIQQPRPIAASPSPQAAQGGFVQPPQRWPHGHVPPHTQGQRISPAVSPAPSGSQGNKPAASPYAPPRPAIPEHMIRHAASATPQARRASAAPAVPPTTPTPQLSLNLQMVRGFGTKWAPQSTPSTPRPLNEEPASPAYEMISPPLRPATLPRSSTMPAAGKANTQIRQPPLPASAPKGKRMRKLRDATGTPLADARRRSESVASGADELSMDYPDAVAKVKNEEATPRSTDEIGDTTADESTVGRPVTTPGSISRVLKRKRQETPPEPSSPPTHVLWTRGFIKVSASAIEHISGHKDGNMFASAIRDKDAPNYSQIVLQPQNISSIRAAVKTGNKAAVQAANALPGGDPGTPSVWLPISDDLTPPKGIINSGQLEREVMHMLSNAIMYNPDPDKGVNRKFLKADAEEESDAVGYHVDENAFVHNTRSMFAEVEEMLSNLRSAEKGRMAGGPPPSTPKTGSVATPADDTAEEEDELAADGDAATSGTVKRRRVGLGRA